MLTEWRSGKPGFDLVIGARGPLNLRRRIVSTLNTAGERGEFPASSKIRTGNWSPGASRLSGFSTIRARQAERCAQSLDDLLDPSADQDQHADPSRHASTAQYLWNMQQVKGEKWMDFVRGLAKQKPMLVESYSSVPNTIVRGETSVGITYIQYAGQTKGPISFAPIGQVFADPSDAALSAKAANVNAARLFVEYLCSPEGQKKVAETGEFVLSPGIFPNVKGGEKIMSGLYLMEDPSADQLAKLQNEFRQLFLSK